MIPVAHALHWANTAILDPDLARWVRQQIAEGKRAEDTRPVLLDRVGRQLFPSGYTASLVERLCRISWWSGS